MFRRVLVANRGEIAVRIIRALRDRGIESVALYTPVDRPGLPVRLADFAVQVTAYLDIAAILQAARESGAEAIHPGYGFLSENAAFAAACESAGIRFIGPPSAAIARMGLKTEAREVAIAAGAPVVPGSDGPVASPEQALAAAALIGYPLMLKARAGGGGKGMRQVASPDALPAALRDASSEAERSFGDGSVYLEKLIVRPRHIEIQVLGDHYGHMIYLGERECSLQRRHQKVVEECPSPFVARHPELRRRMGEAAVRVALAAGYHNAGTVEFLVDDSGEFYFLEMNTRLQVEHPVTEMVTGLDLVDWQLRIASGERLTISQEDVRWRGAAIECRICAEDPERNFLPSPGRIARLREPSGPGIRVDSGVYPGWTVPLDYDPLLAKLIAWGEDREQARRRALRALSEYAVDGIDTNTAFFTEILQDPGFIGGAIHTAYLAEFLASRPSPVQAVDPLAIAVAAAAAPPAPPPAPVEATRRWTATGRRELMR